MISEILPSIIHIANSTLNLELQACMANETAHKLKYTEEKPHNSIHQKPVCRPKI